MSNEPKERKLHDPFVVRLHKSSDAQRKRDEERTKNPVFRRRSRDTERESSIRFYEMWH